MAAAPRNGDPAAGRGPESPADLSGRSWWRTIKRTVSEFRDDELTDRAAALVYYALLSIFPTLIVLVALIGLFGQYPQTVNTLLDAIAQVAPSSTVDTLRGTLAGIVQDKGGAAALLGVGLLTAMWSASGYIGAFMRAANHVYEVEEGRPAWKLRPLQIALTIASVVAIAFMAVGFTFTGQLADSTGRAIGVGDAGTTAWAVAKWPVMAVVTALMFSVLYYVAPNIRQPKFRWITPGGAVGLLLLIVASVGFAFYVANFGSYNKTYGTLGGIVVFLVWLWIGNLALLFGLELDAELERERELQAGLPAEHELQLPPREAADED